MEIVPFVWEISALEPNTEVVFSSRTASGWFVSAPMAFSDAEDAVAKIFTSRQLTRLAAATYIARVSPPVPDAVALSVHARNVLALDSDVSDIPDAYTAYVFAAPGAVEVALMTQVRIFASRGDVLGKSIAFRVTPFVADVSVTVTSSRRLLAPIVTRTVFAVTFSF